MEWQIQASLVDVSTGNKKIECLEDIPFISRDAILSCYTSVEEHPSYELPDDRGKAITIMSNALGCFLQKSYEDGNLVGVIGLGGSGGTSLIAPALRSLPLGVPKIIVSTVASGQTEPYIGTSDLILFPSVVDICGINSVSRLVLSNAGAAAAGMIIENLFTSDMSSQMAKKPTIGMTMFGVTTPCITYVKERLVKEGFETLVFHATGTGGKAMEELVRAGLIQVMIFPNHINDPEFAEVLVDSFLEIFKFSRSGTPPQRTPESQSLVNDILIKRNYSDGKAIWRAPIDFPDAKPGFRTISVKSIILSVLVPDIAILLHSFEPCSKPVSILECFATQF
ncbi:hypothetical protein B296_00020477 [Ensete ventricosum]|uniref:Uncharacterized protein n=1 Tax=Ensete ventricosum TaxID=4639 RepID=A0A426Z1C8_ENSVE|nr:hypothetical protein B296_00020477 [Ensete ventricosum]